MSAAEDQVLTELSLFEIPGMRQLTAQQNTGTACVWCADPLVQGTRVDLRAGIGWEPHSCRTCYPIRVAVVTTYRNLYTHWTTCEQCETAALVGDRLCADATTQQTALLRARTAAGKGRPICVSCHELITEQELNDGTFAPLVWMGYSAPHRGFIHTGACLWHGSTL
ncbi:hypothetical protein ACFVT5_40265 [Streptomyces sp. NPDC058001]|uniref:hypothetical protein n=1 Tax=Streptomyces sp. NPDC058001 TaxID=3346300 RepID=UPI0036F0F3B7